MNPNPVLRKRQETIYNDRFGIKYSKRIYFKMLQQEKKQNTEWTSMEKKDNKILEELRRRGKIFEDPCPKPESIIGKLIDLFSKKKS